MNTYKFGFFAITLGLFLLLYPIASGAQTIQNPANSWTVIQSEVTFKIKNAKLQVEGTFKDLTSTIVFNPLKDQGNYFNGTVNVSTIQTGIDMRDKHLKKKEYFDAQKFPTISINSSSITKVAYNQYNAKCAVTIKGITKEINFPFTFSEIKSTGVFTGNITLNRLDFGVGSSSVVMSNTVLVFITLSAKKIKQ
jgi:polyisoprenoid-binding protein YceI